MKESTFLELCGAPVAAQDFVEKWVKYSNNIQSVETTSGHRYLIDDGSNGYFYVVESIDETVSTVRKIDTEKSLPIEKSQDLGKVPDRIVIEYLCGKPDSNVTAREDVPNQTNSAVRQRINLFQESIYRWRDKKFKLTFSNDSLISKLALKE